MNILYATDGSDGALAAAHFLGRLPLGDDCQVCLLTVIEVEGGEAEANDVLARTRTALGETRARVSTRIRHGDPTQQILEQARRGSDAEDSAQVLDDVSGVPDDNDAIPDLVIVGTHGRGLVARLFLGSVAERVARHAPCPVLLARPHSSSGGELGPIIVGLDGSDNATRALDWLMHRLPLPPGGEIRLARVVTPPAFMGYVNGSFVPAYSEAIAAALQQETQDARADLARNAAELKGAAAAGTATRTIVAEPLPGDAASVLLDAARDHNAGLLVVGSYGSTGLERFLLGSVSEKVLRHADCSVLIVR